MIYYSIFIIYVLLIIYLLYHYEKYNQLLNKHNQIIEILMLLLIFCVSYIYNLSLIYTFLLFDLAYEHISSCIVEWLHIYKKRKISN